MSSPTPPVVNPSPLAIGRTFLKQYYQVLTTTPDMIHKFYRPSSVLSHGEGSNPTVPTTLESLTNSSSTTNLKDRFVSWTDSSSGDPVRFELENGAIDAQESVNGGVLLVVTGHMYLGDARKQFCHTFFLNVFSAENSNRRQYYVHNDVLRFLQEEKTFKDNDVTEVADAGDIAVAEDTPIDSQAKVEEEIQEIGQETVSKDVLEPELESVVEDIAEPVVVLDLPEEFMEGVEETKDDLYADVAEAEATGDLDPAVKEGVIVKEQKVPKAESAVEPKPPPGSWASLVASGGNGVTDPVKAVPAKKHTQPAPKKEKSPVPEEQSAKKEKEVKKGPELTAPKPADAKPRGRRDPDFTLVIKNVQDGVKEADVRLVFEPFAVQTNSKIVGITVSQRGLAFVDYDSAAPVLAALEKRDSFSLNGKSVNIDQKTNDNSSSKNRGRGGNTNPNRSNGQRSGRSSSNGQPNNSSSANGGTRKDGGRKEGTGAKSGSSGGGR